MSDARLEIMDVLARYAHGVDRIDLDLVAGCYHADATEDRGRFQGPLPTFLVWLEEALRALESTWHQLGLPLIELDGDVAHVETHCLGHHRTRATADAPAVDRLIPCRYIDRFERRGGAWRIAARRCVYEPTLTFAPT